MDKRVSRLTDKAIKIMAESVDVLHDEGHVKRMLEDWNQLSEKISSGVNCDAVVLAICWHDVWLATHNYVGIWGVLWEYIREGRGSEKMFRRSAKQIGLDKKMIDLVADAIKNHPSLPGNKQKTIEAKILWDVDNLETWSWPRLKKMIEKIGDEIDKDEAKKIKMARIYWKLVMKKRMSDRLYFDWSKKEFDERKKSFEEKIRILELQYGKLGMV